MPKSRPRSGDVWAIATCAAVWLWEWFRICRTADESAWNTIFPPALAALLLILRPTRHELRPSAPDWLPAAGAVALSALLAIWPWLQPFPGWPLAEWGFSLALFGLAFVLTTGAFGTEAAASALRPMLVALAALPWPAFITAGVMGWLRTGTAAILADGLTWAGRPALADGTALQVGRGTIGLEEACGGIRSMQMAVLLSLAIGALRQEKTRQQINWLFAGIALALSANTLRLATLAWICGAGGNAAVERWHDRMAAAEFAVVLLGFGALALRPSSPPSRSAPPIPPAARSVGRGYAILGFATLICLLAGALSIHEWFDRPKGHPAADFDWTVRLPIDSPSSWSSAMQALLRCDQHQVGSWRDRDGRRREGYVIEWHDNPNAANALSAHNPQICLPLAGSEPIGMRQPVAIDQHGHHWIFSVEAFSNRTKRFELYYLTEYAEEPIPAGGSDREASPLALSWPARWREVAAGRRGMTARTMAVAIFDAPSPAEADREFRAEFAHLIVPRR